MKAQFPVAALCERLNWQKSGSHRQPLQATSKSRVQCLPCTDILSTAAPRQFSPSSHHFAVNDFAKKPSQSA